VASGLCWEILRYGEGMESIGVSYNLWHLETVVRFDISRTQDDQTGIKVSEITFLDPLVFYASAVIFNLINHSLKFLVWMLVALVVEIMTY